MIHASEKLAAIELGWDRYLHSQVSEPPVAEPRSYVYASARRGCVRWMALDLMHPEEREVFSIDSLDRMHQGRDFGRNQAVLFTRVGERSPLPFDVIEAERRFEIKDRDGTLIIVGKVDLRFKFEDGSKPIAEVKGGEAFANIKSIEDCDRSPWTQHAPDQLLAYLYAESEPLGFLVLRIPGKSRPRIIPVHLEDHLDRAESFLRDARAAVDARFGHRSLPPFTEDRSECRRCPHFRKSCTPPDFRVDESTHLITDPEALRRVEQMMDLVQDGKQYNRLRRVMNEYVGDVVGGQGPVTLIFGDAVARVAKSGRVSWERL